LSVELFGVEYIWIRLGDLPIGRFRGDFSGLECIVADVSIVLCGCVLPDDRVVRPLRAWYISVWYSRCPYVIVVFKASVAFGGPESG
jgi:hypothetical protein